jgi:oligopeptidase A
MGQLCIAKLDLEMHMNYNEKFKGKDMDAATNELLAPWQIRYTTPGTSIMRRLRHCITGGYTAGYYSYKWAEVLAADAYSRFRKEGAMNSKTGQDFRREILSKGDSSSAAELYRNFMGRDPNPDALLQSQGLCK